jgi:hypothetical protein
MARIAATKCSGKELQRLVQDACMAYQGAYEALRLAIVEVHGALDPQQRVKVIGIRELSPEEQSRLGRSLAVSRLASYRRRAGLLSLALLAELPSTKFDKAALEQTLTVSTQGLIQPSVDQIRSKASDLD